MLKNLSKGLTGLLNPKEEKRPPSSHTKENSVPHKNGVPHKNSTPHKNGPPHKDSKMMLISTNSNQSRPDRKSETSQSYKRYDSREADSQKKGNKSNRDHGSDRHHSQHSSREDRGRYPSGGRDRRYSDRRPDDYYDSDREYYNRRNYDDSRGRPYINGRSYERSSSHEDYYLSDPDAPPKPPRGHQSRNRIYLPDSADRDRNGYSNDTSPRSSGRPPQYPRESQRDRSRNYPPPQDSRPYSPPRQSYPDPGMASLPREKRDYRSPDESYNYSRHPNGNQDRYYPETASLDRRQYQRQNPPNGESNERYRNRPEKRSEPINSLKRQDKVSSEPFIHRSESSVSHASLRSGGGRYYQEAEGGRKLMQGEKSYDRKYYKDKFADNQRGRLEPQVPEWLSQPVFSQNVPHDGNGETRLGPRPIYRSDGELDLSERTRPEQRRYEPPQRAAESYMHTERADQRYRRRDNGFYSTDEELLSEPEREAPARPVKSLQQLFEPGQPRDLSMSDVPPRSSDIPPRSSDIPPRSSDIPPRSSDIPPRSSDIPPRSSRIPPRTSNVPPKSSEILSRGDIYRSGGLSRRSNSLPRQSSMPETYAPPPPDTAVPRQNGNGSKGYSAVQKSIHEDIIRKIEEPFSERAPPRSGFYRENGHSEQDLASLNNNAKRKPMIENLDPKENQASPPLRTPREIKAYDQHLKKIKRSSTLPVTRTTVTSSYISDDAQEHVKAKEQSMSDPETSTPSVKRVSSTSNSTVFCLISHANKGDKSDTRSEIIAPPTKRNYLNAQPNVSTSRPSSSTLLVRGTIEIDNGTKPKTVQEQWEEHLRRREERREYLRSVSRDSSTGTDSDAQKNNIKNILSTMPNRNNTDKPLPHDYSITDQELYNRQVEPMVDIFKEGGGEVVEESVVLPSVSFGTKSNKKQRPVEVPKPEEEETEHQKFLAKRTLTHQKSYDESGEPIRIKTLDDTTEKVKELVVLPSRSQGNVYAMPGGTIDREQISRYTEDKIQTSKNYSDVYSVRGDLYREQPFDGRIRVSDRYDEREADRPAKQTSVAEDEPSTSVKDLRRKFMDTRGFENDGGVEFGNNRKMRLRSQSIDGDQRMDNFAEVEETPNEPPTSTQGRGRRGPYKKVPARSHSLSRLDSKRLEATVQKESKSPAAFLLAEAEQNDKMSKGVQLFLQKRKESEIHDWKNEIVIKERERKQGTVDDAKVNNEPPIIVKKEVTEECSYPVLNSKVYPIGKQPFEYANIQREVSLTMGEKSNTRLKIPKRNENYDELDQAVSDLESLHSMVDRETQDALNPRREDPRRQSLKDKEPKEDTVLDPAYIAELKRLLKEYEEDVHSPRGRRKNRRERSKSDLTYMLQIALAQLKQNQDQNPSVPRSTELVQNLPSRQSFPLKAHPHLLKKNAGSSSEEEVRRMRGNSPSGLYRPPKSDENLGYSSDSSPDLVKVKMQWAAREKQAERDRLTKMGSGRVPNGERMVSSEVVPSFRLPDKRTIPNEPTIQDEDNPISPTSFTVSSRSYSDVNFNEAAYVTYENNNNYSCDTKTQQEINRSSRPAGYTRSGGKSSDVSADKSEVDSFVSSLETLALSQDMPLEISTRPAEQAEYRYVTTDEEDTWEAEEDRKRNGASSPPTITLVVREAPVVTENLFPNEEIPLIDDECSDDEVQNGIKDNGKGKDHLKAGTRESVSSVDSQVLSQPFDEMGSKEYERMMGDHQKQQESKEKKQNNTDSSMESLTQMAGWEQNSGDAPNGERSVKNGKDSRISSVDEAYLSGSATENHQAEIKKD